MSVVAAVPANHRVKCARLGDFPVRSGGGPMDDELGGFRCRRTPARADVLGDGIEVSAT